MEDVLVSDLATSCIDQFQGLLAVLEQTGQVVNARLNLAFDEQYGRFNVWAGNLGVFARAHASLDYRLRDSPKAKDLFVSQLEGLQSYLERGMFDNKSRFSVLLMISSSPLDDQRARLRL